MLKVSLTASAWPTTCGKVSTLALASRTAFGRPSPMVLASTTATWWPSLKRKVWASTTASARPCVWGCA